MEPTSQHLCHLCRNPTDGGGVCTPCYGTLPLQSQIKSEKFDSTSQSLCHLCQIPTNGSGVCSLCYKTLPNEYEIKKEEETISEMSVSDIQLAEKLIQNWITAGRDIFINGYSPQISFKTGECVKIVSKSLYLHQHY